MDQPVSILPHILKPSSNAWLLAGSLQVGI